MNTVWNVLWKLMKILFVVGFVLFIVYFWNIDQKVMGWAYVKVNQIHDRKNVDIKF